MKLTEAQIVDKLEDWLEREADAFDIAKIAGEVFGGTCNCEVNDDGEIDYMFSPDKNYSGAFDINQ
jgi:hypothetical protein